MLKLAYSESGFHLEHLSGSLNEAIARYLLVANRFGRAYHVEPSYAAIIVPEASPELAQLEQAIATHGAAHWNEDAENISLCASLAHGIEIILQGYWLSGNASTAEGLFFVSLPLGIEQPLLVLWKSTGSSVVSYTWSAAGHAFPELGYEF